MTAAFDGPSPKLDTIIKHDRVRIGDGANETPPALPGSSQRGGARCKKSVQLLREQDVVHAIELRCSCGEVTVVEINYGSQASQES